MMTRPVLSVLAWVVVLGAFASACGAAEAPALRAGVAKVDIADPAAGPANDPPYVKALVLDDGKTRLALITVDAVAIGGIGPVPGDYLAKVRARLQAECGIAPGCVLANASHCHAAVRRDVAELTVQAVQAAVRGMVPVRAGAGAGREDRIMINRRLTLKDGSQADVRHAYSLPPDEQVQAVGPVDPQIGLLRLDREDGRPLAVVFNFACHPIQGVPSGRNTADISGFACRAIEDAFGDGLVALFIQGCAGDINPAGYKAVGAPRDAEPMGNLLGLSAVRAARAIRCDRQGELKLVSRTLDLPRADWTARIAALQVRQEKLVASLQGTTLNLKSFLPLAVRYGLDAEFPSAPADAYLHERAASRPALDRLDDENRRNLQQYLRNIHVMEELTRVRTNLDLLRKHQAANVAAGHKPIPVEIAALRVGPFVLTTFPGELCVQIGLDLKKASPHKHTFVAGYTNGYIYYAPTAEQLANPGSAQEDCDCLLGPTWQGIYERAAVELLKGL